MEFKSSPDGKIINDHKQNVNETGPSKIVCKDLCDRRDLKIKEAEKTIANKDVIIRMLQEHVRKLEESYKHNLKATEDFRYKYCLASEQVKQLRSCTKYCTATSLQQKDEKEPKPTINNLATSKYETSKLTSNTCPEDCIGRGLPKRSSTYSTQSKTLEQFKKGYYEMIQSLVEKILEQKNIALKESQTDYSNMFVTMDQLQYEITRLNEANEKLQEQIDLRAYRYFPPIKDSIIETYHKKNTELQSAVSKLKNLVPDILNEESEDTPQEISCPVKETPLQENFAKDNENYTTEAAIVNKAEENQYQSRNNTTSNNFKSENSRNDNTTKSRIQKNQKRSRSCITTDAGNSIVNDTSETKKEQSSIVYQIQNDNVGKTTRTSRNNSVSTNTGMTTSGEAEDNQNRSVDTAEQTASSNMSQRSPKSAKKRITNSSSQKRVCNNGCSNAQLICGISIDKTESDEDENQSRNDSPPGKFRSNSLKKDQNECPSCTNPKCLRKVGKCGCNGNAKGTANSAVGDSSEAKQPPTVYANQNDIRKESVSKTISTNTATITSEDGSGSSREKQMTSFSEKGVRNNDSPNTPTISGSSGLYKTELTIWLDDKPHNDEKMVTMQSTSGGYNDTRLVIANEDNLQESTVVLSEETKMVGGTLTEMIHSLEPTISETIQTRYASISTVSDESLVDVSSYALHEKTTVKTVKTDISVTNQSEEEAKNLAVRAETRISKEFSSLMLASTLTEIKVKIVELVEKQDSACKEIEVVKNQMLIAQETTQSCRAQISKLTESVEGQKETFVVKFQENKTITDELKQSNDKIKMELGELKDKIGILFTNINELKEKQKTMDRVKVLRQMSESDIITVEECKRERLRKESNKEMESSTSGQSQGTRFVVTETLDLRKKERPVSSKMQECNVLQEHLPDLQKEKLQKDQQITCLNELISSYSKINNGVATVCSDIASTDNENHLTEFRYDDDEIQDYIEKIREENHKLKTTISCVIGHLQEKMKELDLKISADNIAAGVDSITNDSCTCNSESSSTCLNRVPSYQSQDHPEIQIEDIYNAVLRSVTPFKKCDETASYSCKSVKSITCCCNVNIDHFVDQKKSGQGINIEDIYKAVLCSCNSKNESDQQKSITSVNKIRSNRSVGGSVESKDKCLDKISCSCLGHCSLDLDPNFSDGKSIVSNLQTYVQYLHEQLQVITNIENQIEDLRVDIKNPQS